MTAPAGHCDLCGLPLNFGSRDLNVRNRDYRFCCTGCRMVFSMLLEAENEGDPEKFSETALFQRCVEMGLVPASEEHLARMALRNLEVSRTVGAGNDDASPEDHPHLTMTMKISGMWCPACAWAIEESLKKQPGVSSAACNFSTDRLQCRYDPVVTTPDHLESMLNRLGYPPHPDDESVTASERKRELFRFVLTALLTANVMMLSFALYTGFFSELDADAIHKISWPMAVMAAIVFFYGGKRIHQRAWTGIVHAAPGMEALVSLGASCTFFYSVYGTLTGSIHQYYDTASMLITLILIGKSLENRTREEVNRDLESFFDRRPTKVKLCSEIRPQGQYVHIDQLAPGSLFLAGENETVAADGMVVEGEAMVDESAITGEARPVRKAPGIAVTGGTRITSGTLRIQATAIGSDTVLGRMIEIMEGALNRKTPLEGKTDRILHGFVPGVILLAIATAATCSALGMSTEAAFVRAVTVLVITCPCALGIAIPLTRVAGISMARKAGILVSNFSSFESMQKIDAFVLDKTGTVTKGDWRILDVTAVGRLSVEEILSISAGLETGNAHFIAGEIRRHAWEKGIAPAEINILKTFQEGVQGQWQGQTVRIGSKPFAVDGSVNVNARGIPASGDRVSSQVFLGIEKNPCGVITFGDRLKPTSAESIGRLMDAGYAVYMISGDEENAVAAVAGNMGIPSYAGGKNPAEKAAFIQELQRGGRIVAMVGRWRQRCTGPCPFQFGHGDSHGRASGMGGNGCHPDEGGVDPDSGFYRPCIPG